MVKGVNKNIIEISDTGNECFERVILFVRPESMEKGGDHLYRKAKAYLSGLRLRPRLVGGKQQLLIQVAKWCGAIAVGAGIAVAVLKF